ncbi:XRE family transcriptional regulator [Rhizobium oryzicola]|uniref:XRE family transcriptional regulator n=1 Tax=Rhizobium oryzicola TaxID=1232668 RepID=A0ABT8T4E6_9HYPH|nr:XRE family transcriptional regulator [Rhizobium oryzicola]MDO1585630.1 XRE family transcriptional regulator [Rhizobium oryzicola]
MAAERAHVMQKSVSAAESGKTVLVETNYALVDYYRSAGIVFLGEGQIGEEVQGAGAKWSGPEGPTHIPLAEADFHLERVDVSFRAARALVGKEQAEVARSAGISLDALKSLEKNVMRQSSYSKLRQWFEDQGVEFTGWGDISTQTFVGVGVRWRR